jgi:SAM-dependent methyltransferase
MTTLLDLIYRGAPLPPWSPGEGLPWHDPGFSERMLREHLSQEHDVASRRFDKIDRQVAWIDAELLDGAPARILDLGCGPGFYCERLAALGHDCVGIDLSPASIRYAGARAAESGSWCSYTLGDVRHAELGLGYGLAMLLFGEFSTLSPRDADIVLDRVRLALDPGGLLLLEPHTFDDLAGRAGRRRWRSADRGVFLDRPHLTLREEVWHEGVEALGQAWYVIDGADGEVMSYRQTMRAYRDGTLRELLGRHGFDEVAFLPSLLGVADPEQTDLQAVVARKRAAAV